MWSESPQGDVCVLMEQDDRVIIHNLVIASPCCNKYRRCHSDEDLESIGGIVIDKIGLQNDQ